MCSPQRRIVQPSRGCRAASRQKLNVSWGMALVPAGFGKFSNRLLVGDFGDGRMNVFDLATGEFVGQLEPTDNVPVQIEGLCGFAFGNGFLNQPAISCSLPQGRVMSGTEPMPP